MTEKELLSKLNSLKSIQPASDWKNTGREILISQISNGQELKENEVSLLDLFFKKTEWLAQPVGVFLLIISAVFGTGILSIKAARDTKPGDSLYIAKIISEKTQQAITFDEKEKAKLEIKFASNRADEIAKVLEHDKSEKKDDRVEKLTNDFKKEISAAKIRLEKINGVKDEDKPEENSASSTQVAEAEDQVFSADFEKTKDGMQIEIKEVAVAPAAEDPKKVLDEAKQLFEKEDYIGTLNKLEEANAIVEKTAGSVDAADAVDNATSTVGVVAEKEAATSTGAEK